MPPGEKKFVKYAFQQLPNHKPRESTQPRQVRQPKQNLKQRDNNVHNRIRRHVSYTQKPISKQNVLRDMINLFMPVNKPPQKVEELLRKFPKYFNPISKQPEPFSHEPLNSYLIIMGRKPIQRQGRPYAPIDHESQEQPNWDSQSDQQGGIQSRKIDEKVIEKFQQKMGNLKQLRNDELKRHQKQFLEDYYRQKHQQQLEREEEDIKNGGKQKQKENQKDLLEETTLNYNQWTEYQEKQVNDFVNMGFIQKIEEQPNQQYGAGEEIEFEADEDFSVQDQKSDKQISSQSSEVDDDIFGDQGPTTIVKKKQIKDSDKNQHKNFNSISQGTVLINSHLFSRIAEQVGIPPGACIWIISNKSQRYKVTTQFMDQMYRLNNFAQFLPYISLNHSQFVHNNDVQKQKGLSIFRNFNARKHQYHVGNSHQNKNKNYESCTTKRKFQQFKPNPNQPVLESANPQQHQRPHLNKK